MIVGKPECRCMKNGSRKAQKLFLESSEGFPNLFIVSGPQGGGGSFNFTDAIDTHAEYIVKLLEKMRDERIRVVDIDSDSENRYADHCREADTASAPLRDCISYYNGEGGRPWKFGLLRWERVAQNPSRSRGDARPIQI